jgi:glutathione S-transferase
MCGSACCQRVLMTALEVEAEYNMNIVNLMEGVHKQPDFLAKQPFGVIPALVDGDLTVYESRAIGRYINDARGSKVGAVDLRSHTP